MSKKFRKVLSAVLAATMVLGSGVVANAADPEGSGDGTGEAVYIKNPEVFNVVLPTDSGTQFNYILDPDGVIEATQYEKYGGVGSVSFTPTGTTGNMWFENEKATESDPRKFTNESDPIKAYNKSNISVDIEVEATLATPSGITIATQSVAGTGNSTATPSMYLALKTSDGNEKAVVAAGTTATASIATAADAAYETRYVNGEYVKQLTATAADVDVKTDTSQTFFQSYSFTLTGDCSQGNWKALTQNPPTVSLVWTINKPDSAVEAAPASALSKKTISASANVIDVTGATVTAVKLIKKDTTTEIACASPTNYTFANGKLSVTASMLANNVGGKLKVVLSTGVTEEVTIQ